MATPPSHAGTPHTGHQEDSGPLDKLEDVPSAAARERRSLGRKFLHSKAMQKVAGRRLGPSAVQPAEKDKEQSPSSRTVATSNRQSSTTSAVQSHQAAGEPVKQQGPFFQQGSPSTSPRVTSKVAQSHQAEHKNIYEPHQKDKKEGEHCHDDPPLVSNDQRVQLLELANLRLKREKTTMEATLAEYEQQIVAKDREINLLRKPKTSPLLHVPPPVTNEVKKLEMSLVHRDTQLTQLKTERDLLQHEKDVIQQELLEMQANYKTLESQHQADAHQIETATHQARTTENEKVSLKDEIIRLNKQLLKTEREMKELEHSSQEQQLKKRVKQLEDEKKGRDASEGTLVKQYQNNQKHLEKSLKRAEEEVSQLKQSQSKSELEQKQLREQLQTVQDQLEDRNKEVKQTKRLVQAELEKGADMTRLKEDLEREKKQVETARQLVQQLTDERRQKEEKLAEQHNELVMVKEQLTAAQQEVDDLEEGKKSKEQYEIRLTEQQQELVKIQQQLMTSQQEAAEGKKKKKEYKTKIAELKQQMEEMQQQHQIEAQYEQIEMPQQIVDKRENSWRMVGGNYQTLDGAGASLHTSLEYIWEELQVDMREELTTKDQQLAELRKRLEHEELLNKQLQETVLDLKADLRNASSAMTSASKFTDTVNDELEKTKAELRDLKEESITKKDEIGFLNAAVQQYHADLEQLKEDLETKNAQLRTAIKTGEGVARINQTLNDEKAHLAQQLQTMNKTIESLSQKIDMQDLVAARQELAAVSQDLVAARQELRTKQHMVTELEGELAGAKAQALIYQQDFLQERRDRESSLGKLCDIKDQSAARVNRLESKVQELEEKVGKTTAVNEDLKEDYQISQSQIIAYKKQMDISKREAEAEKRKVEEMRVEVGARQSQVDELGRQLDTIKRVAEAERKKSEHKQCRIDGLNSQMRIMSTENTQLKRAASTFQMESTRADRLQNELDHMSMHNRELVRINDQLKVSNQKIQQQLATKGDKHTTVIFEVDGLNEGEEKGRGSFGVVYEVRVNGVPCIAKRLHDILVGRGGHEPVRLDGRKAVIKRFQQECDLLSCLRHPNVVQFMGVHYGRDEADISLIMEYMHMDLEDCMETYPNIPLSYKTRILRDVAYGLAYLHSIPIIHRDLNAGNVLLTESLRAKIADLGVAKLFDREVAMIRTRTVCPGAQDFMPPESWDDSPKYDDKLDVFSFGHLAIYLINQKAPHVLDRTVTRIDFDHQQVQVGKRRRSLDQMGGPHHPLYATIVQCLSDTPDQRPTSRDLVRRMEQTCQQFPMPHENILQILQTHDAVVTTDQTLSKSVDSLEPDPSLPPDPNLVCPQCGKQYGKTEIQKLRKHYKQCSGASNH